MVVCTSKAAGATAGRACETSGEPWWWPLKVVERPGTVSPRQSRLDVWCGDPVTGNGTVYPSYLPHQAQSDACRSAVNNDLNGCAVAESLRMRAISANGLSVIRGNARSQSTRATFQSGGVES